MTNSPALARLFSPSLQLMVPISSCEQACPLPPLLPMFPLCFLSPLSHTVLSREKDGSGPRNAGVWHLHSIPGHCREPGSIPAPAAEPWTRSASSCPETSAPRHRDQSPGAGPGPQSCLMWNGGGVLDDCSVEGSLGPSQFFAGADTHSVEPLTKIPPEPDLPTPWMSRTGRKAPALPA